jgi:hypothetical protein
MSCQRCVARVIEYQIATKQMVLQSLLDGKEEALTQIHAALMFYLVVDTAEPALTEEHGLVSLQAEYQYIALAVALLTTIGQDFIVRGKPSDARVLTTIAETFVPNTRREIDVTQTVDDIDKALELSSLTPKAIETLKTELVHRTQPSDIIYETMAGRVQKYWWYGDQLTPEPMNAGKALIPRINEAASKLRAITKFHRMVHAKQYNQIIREEAQRIKVLAAFPKSYSKSYSNATQTRLFSPSDAPTLWSFT